MLQKQESVGLAMNLKMSLWMLTGRTYCRCFCTLIDITAVAAFPLDRGFLLEDLAVFDIVGKLQITTLVAFLDLSNFTECLANFSETFLLSYFSEINIEISPFFMLTLSGGNQVVIGCAKSYWIFCCDLNGNSL